MSSYIKGERELREEIREARHFVAYDTLVNYWLNNVDGFIGIKIGNALPLLIRTFNTKALRDEEKFDDPKVQAAVDYWCQVGAPVNKRRDLLQKKHPEAITSYTFYYGDVPLVTMSTRSTEGKKNMPCQ